MRDIHEVLREKEAELQQLTKEVEALRLAVSLLDERKAPAPTAAPAATPRSPLPTTSSESITTDEASAAKTPASRPFP